MKIWLALAIVFFAFNVSSAHATSIRLGEGTLQFHGRLAPIGIPIVGIGMDKSTMQFFGQENVITPESGTHPTVTDLTIDCGGGGMPLDNFTFERVRFRNCILTYNNGPTTLRSVAVEHSELRSNNLIAKPNSHQLWMSFACGKERPEAMPDFFSCPNVTITLD
jgi:hypothetical protein